MLYDVFDDLLRHAKIDDADLRDKADHEGHIADIIDLPGYPF